MVAYTAQLALSCVLLMAHKAASCSESEFDYLSLSTADANGY
jgi:hypothetical protein